MSFCPYIIFSYNCISKVAKQRFRRYGHCHYFFSFCLFEGYSEYNSQIIVNLYQSQGGFIVFLDMTLTLLSVLANIMVISAVRDRLGMGPQYRYRDIISIEPSGRSSLKATTTFFLSTSAVPTCSVLSSPSQFLSSTLGKRLSSFR